MVDFTDFGAPATPSPPASPAPKGGGAVDFDSFQGGGDVRTQPDSNVRTPSHLEQFGKGILTGTVEIGDFLDSMLIAPIQVGADMGMRARAIGQGKSREEVSQAGRDASSAVSGLLGNPFHKLMLMAGMGGEEGDQGVLNSTMGRLTSLLEKGGDWVEKESGGYVLSGDVQDIVNTAMAAGGGRGLAAGLEKVVPKDAVLTGMKMTPKYLKAMQEERMQAMPPPEAAKVVEAQAEQAVSTASKAKWEPKVDKIFNPKTGELELDFPPGGTYPTPTTLDTALEKMTSGKGLDMTAEERIAFRAWDKEPPKEVIVDEQGKPLMRVPKGQSGAVDPKLLARMAAVGLGAWAGQHFSDDKDLMGAFIGGVAGFGVSKIPEVVGGLKKFAGADPRIKINGLSNFLDKETQLAAVDVWSLQKQLEGLVPKTERRQAITHAIEAGDLSKLSPAEAKAAKIYTDYADSKLWEGIDSGILKSAKDDYVTHLWDWSKNDKGLVAKWLDRNSGGGGMSPNSPFAQERSIPTIADGKAQGLTPLTEDISTIMGIYGNAISRSIANRHFIDALKLEKDPQGIGLLLPSDQAPHSYVSLNHPQLTGMRVHPDIAPSLKMLFDVSSPGAAMRVMQGLSDTTKRVAVSFSLFHAKALTDALIGGSSNPFKAVGKIPGMALGTDKYLQELRKGSASPLVQRAAEGGLKFSLERTGAGVEDAGSGFYSTMTSLSGFLDKALPGAGLPIEGLKALSEKFDTFMWARLHAGMKLNVFAEKYQTLIDNSAAKASKGKGAALSPEEASRIAASYTNDLFGGLNWRRVAEDAKTRFGREVGQATLNPGARRVLQLIAFAPDWTISTTRAFTQAAGRPDFLKPTTLAGLHQQYLMRAALYYLVVGDSINYAASGHHIWQNKDWTVLDMNAEGTKHMTWSKHTMEPIHWMMKPAQQGLNKLGMLPREALEQGLGVEYLSAKGRMPPMESRVKHFAKNFAPIAVQQGQDGGLGAGISGFLGAPIYGKTKEEKAKAAAERKKKRKVKL